MSCPWFLRLSRTWLSFLWSSQVSPWTYRTSMCAPCSPRTSTISSDTRAPSPLRPATRASSGLCSIRPSLSHTIRYSRQDSMYLSGYSCYLWTVTVTVLRKPAYFEYYMVSLLVCCAQIRKLEGTLMDIDNKTLWNDYRIAQPLNDRVVESSFLPRLGKGSV